MTISVVPDSEEFTHFDDRAGTVNAVFIDKDNAKIEFFDGDNTLPAYFDFDGLKELYYEIEQVLFIMMEQS